MKFYSKAQMQAYADFLLSEKLRHEEDIKNIEVKLAILYDKGIIAVEEGPWITEEELKGQNNYDSN